MIYGKLSLPFLPSCTLLKLRAMTSRKIDQILLSLGVVLIIISSYQLFLSRLLQGSDSGLSLGTLENTEAVVKIKSSLALDWRDAYRGTDVSEQQLIYTDDDSSAEIKFTQGHKVLISENSLIRIATIGKGLNVERGLIRAKIQGDQPLIIEMNGEELKLTGKDADVQISLQGDVGEIGVLNGEISVEKEGQVEQIDKTSSLKVDQESLKKQNVSVTLMEPKASEVFYTLDETYPASFKWDPATNGEMLLADNPAFKRSTVYRGEGSVQANVKPGSYYWKVEEANGTSLIGSFSVIREIAPEVLRPVNGEKITRARGPQASPELFLQWKGQVGQDYVVEYKEQEVKSQIVKGSGLVVPLTISGIFQWRVKISDEKRTLATWSEWQNVEVNIVDLPDMPVNLAPEELELQSYSKEEQDVELSWNSNKPVELEILAPKNEKLLKNPESSSFILKVKEPGLYRWRVRAKDEFERFSEWSDYKSFTLEDLSHEVTDGFQRIQLKKPDQEVTFNWKAESGSNTVFELSEGKEFSEVIVKKEVKGEEVKVVIPKTGNFYWRSRQYHPDGTFNVSEPKKVIIEPAPAPTKPEKLPDVEVPLEWQETTTEFKWWNIFISEAHADEFKGVARIQLPVNEDAKKYVIKIYADPEGAQLVLEQTVDSPVVLWENAKAGRYYWQYALVDFWGRQSPFSDLSILNVTGTEPILPEKPKLHSPIRAVEVENKDLTIRWSESEKNKKYLLEVSPKDDFSDVVLKKETSDSKVEFEEPKLKSGLYFWRVTATNDSKKQVASNTGRFTVKEEPPLERIVIADQKVRPWIKQFPKRLSLAWAPSSDSYEFEGTEKKGKIDGTTMNSLEARFLYFGSNYIFMADVLRQSGEVFEGEKYLFQRLQVHGTWKTKVNNHLWGPGISIGNASGYSYAINDDDTVSSTAVSGLIYGPHLLGFYALNQKWELQGKVSYMLGAIPHMELTGEANRQMKNFYLVLGLGFSNREYSDNEGTQSSMKLAVGLGKEF